MRARSWTPPTDRGVWAFLGFFKTHPGWAAVIAAVNLVGIAYGFWYYREQFAQTPMWLWLFVPDSPLAVLWAEAALLFYWLGRPSASLDALAFVGNVQVGLWTVYVLVAYADSFGTYALNLNTILLGAHAAMALLALVFVQGLRERARAAPWLVAGGVGVAAAYYLVNDLLDYYGPDFLDKGGCGMRPYTVPCDHALEGILTAVTMGLTAFAVVALLAATRPRPR